MKFTKTLAMAGAALFAASMAAVASPAQAAPERRAGVESRRGPVAARSIDLNRVNLTSNNVVLNGDSGCANRVRMTAVVNSPIGDPERLRSVTARFSEPNGSLSQNVRLTRLRSGNFVQYTGYLRVCGNDPVGRYNLRTTLTKSDENNHLRRQVIDKSIWVKRPTTLTYNASPEPVTVGQPLTHAGRLMFDPIGNGGFYGPQNVRMTLLFQPLGSTQWQLRRIFYTGANGFFSFTTAASEDGIWRVNYPSNDFRETQNATDYVDTVPAP
jgi:hypothetical protein